jgi:hypothetical protein
MAVHPVNPNSSSGLSASSSLRALVKRWRGVGSNISGEDYYDGQRYAERKCADELSAALDAHQEEENTNQCLPGTPGPKSCDAGAPVAAWLPIDTAPKDGTWFIGHSGKWGRLPEVVQWSQYAKCWQTMDRGVHPTHWMRLPPLSGVAQSAATTPEEQPATTDALSPATPASSPPERSEGWQPMEQSEDTEVVNAVTAAMREADRVFEKVGGSSRHHVRDCLLPVLNRNGWRVTRSPALPTEPSNG